MEPDDDKQRKDRLSGWKEIADYLGRSPRTAQRWERELGLPVTRLLTPSGQAVFGSRLALDAWLASAKLPPVPSESPVQQIGQDPVAQHVQVPRARTLWVLATICASCVVAYGWLGVNPAHVDRLKVQGRFIEASNDAGEVQWQHDLGRDASVISTDGVPALHGRTHAIASLDLDEDSRADWLVPVRFGASGGTSADHLIALTSDGRHLWSVDGPDRLICGGREHVGPWALTAVTVGKAGKIWAAFSHKVWWPSAVMEISTDGQASTAYIQAGWIMSLQEVGDHLFAGGVLNEFSKASVVLVSRDQSLPFPNADVRFRCQSSYAPEQLVLLPSLDITVAENLPYSFITAMTSDGISLTAHMSSELIIELSTSLEIKQIAFADTFAARHHRMGVGLLRHPWELCAHRTEPITLRHWGRGRGWTDSRHLIFER